MRTAISASTLFAVFALLTALTARADEYDDTIAIFKGAGQSGSFFAKSYGYAVFPTVGKGGLGVGAAHGTGRVYAKGKHVGDTTMNQVSVGLQAGGQAFSQIIFFEDQRAFEEFTSGNFEFGASVQAVAITASAARAPEVAAPAQAPAAARTTPRRSDSFTRAWPCSPSRKAA